MDGVVSSLQRCWRRRLLLLWWLMSEVKVLLLLLRWSELMQSIESEQRARCRCVPCRQRLREETWTMRELQGQVRWSHVRLPGDVSMERRVLALNHFDLGAQFDA